MPGIDEALFHDEDVLFQDISYRLSVGEVGRIEDLLDQLDCFLVVAVQAGPADGNDVFLYLAVVGRGRREGSGEIAQNAPHKPA